jgi:ATP-dependent DNA helicase RecG
VGPKRAEQLSAIGLATFGDLLKYYPLRHLDASQIVRVVDLQMHAVCTIQVVVRACKLVRVPHRNIPLTVIVEDASGQMPLTFFHQPYLVKQLQVGQTYAFTGRVSEFRGHLTMVNPVWEPWGEELLHTGRIVPMYSQSGGVKTGALRKLVFQVLTLLGDHLDSGEYLTPAQRALADLLPYSEAIRAIHFPESQSQFRAAQHRLAFDELWPVVAGIEQARRQREQKNVRTILTPTIWTGAWEQFRRALPFALSPSQNEAIALLASGLTKSYPTQFLIQGEVGSGKTLVAAAAAIAMAAAGGQTLILAPTVILAQQHWQTINTIAQKLNIPVALWTGQQQDSAQLHLPIIVGTQALLTQTQLQPSLLIIDEEHRFGVTQRETPWQSGQTAPHFVSMTATPIPRTLARTLYDAQMVAFLDPLPNKSKQIRTRVTPPHKLDDFWQWLSAQLKQNEQVFLVAPFIEPSLTPGWEEVWSAETLAATAKQVLPKQRVGVLTGRSSGEEKTKLLQAMHDHQLDALIATPVIEVGIDIPQVSLMAIFSAERFGLAQLHQLRGRIGRNGQASWCFLVPTTTAPVDSLDRLESLAESNNGAQLAELDLKTRGAGQFFGSMQSGWDGLNLADSIDLKLIQSVKTVYADSQPHSV